MSFIWDTTLDWIKPCHLQTWCANHAGAHVVVDLKLHGQPMLVDKPNFGLVLYNHANFYRFAESFGYWSVP